MRATQRTTRDGGTLQPPSSFPRGVAAPAIRALRSAGYVELEQLAGVSAADLAKLHGMGPTALARLQDALTQRGLSLG